MFTGGLLVETVRDMVPTVGSLMILEDVLVSNETGIFGSLSLGVLKLRRGTVTKCC